MSFGSDVKSDLARLSPLSVIGFVKQYFFPRGGTFPYVFWLRIMQVCRRHCVLRYTLGVLLYPVYRHYEFKYGIHANPNIKIGGGLCIVHGGNVHLNCETIGENLTVYQGVTFGIHEGARPIVGSGVTVYPNSIIVGGIKIGDGVRVGALSYVSHDVPPGATVAGCPAHVI